MHASIERVEGPGLVERGKYHSLVLYGGSSRGPGGQCKLQ